MNEKKLKTMTQFLQQFSDIISLVPEIEDRVQKAIDKELDRHWIAETIGDDNKIQEMDLFSNIAEFLQKKWNIEILYTLTRIKNAQFTEIKKFIPSIGAKLLTSRLKYLSSERIVKRTELQDNRVFYELTTFGQSVVRLMVPLLVRWIDHQLTETA